MMNHIYSTKKSTLPSQPARPLPPEVVVAGSRSFQEPWLDRHRLLWLEKDPQQQGRTTLMLRDRDGCRELTPARVEPAHAAARLRWCRRCCGR